MRQRLLLVLVIGATAPVAPALASLHPSAAGRPTAFASCPALVGYAQSHFADTKGLPEQPLQAVATATSPANPIGKSASASTPSAAAGAAGSGSASGSSTPAYSTTNDQEPGVDEPDIVKTNGSTIFTVTGNKLYAVNVDGGTPQLVGSLALGDLTGNAQLLLSGSTLLVIADRTPLAFPLQEPALGNGAARPAIVTSPYFFGGQTVLSEVDVSNPAAMSVTETMTIDGSFVDARQNGSTVRLVISSSPEGLIEPALRSSTRGWVPEMSFAHGGTGGAVSRPIARCNEVLRPAIFSGLGMVTILTVNLASGLTSATAQSLMADAQVVYGSQSSLYIATQRWIDPLLPYDQLPPTQTTVIDRFDVTNPDATTFVGSGVVPGYLLNQFSLSEYSGDLRVASTTRPLWWDGVMQPSSSQSMVTVLQTDGNQLVPVGQVSGLGQGEQITSVRFVGPTGYVSTFRQIDPFYTIDLSNPSDPTVTGSLELEGDSSYLQPLGPGLLLGIGQAVDPTSNEPTGTLLELFNVSNPGQPTLVAEQPLGTGSSSQAQYDHHALLYWPPTDLAVLPVQVYSSGIVTPGQSSLPFVGALAFHIDGSGISEIGQIQQDSVDGTTPEIERALVIGDQLFTVSPQGVMASSLGTVAEEAFVAFPAPVVVPPPTPVPVPLPGPIPAPGPLPGISAG
jgi:uncharacterized secreted protein with C-terminal beta-propeller domain